MMGGGATTDQISVCILCKLFSVHSSNDKISQNFIEKITLRVTSQTFVLN